MLPASFHCLICRVLYLLFRRSVDRARQSVRQSLRRKSGRSGNPAPPPSPHPAAPAVIKPRDHHSHSHTSTLPQPSLPPIPSSETSELLGELGAEEDGDGNGEDGNKAPTNPTNGRPPSLTQFQSQSTNHDQLPELPRSPHLNDT